MSGEAVAARAAGRMRCYAELLVELADQADELGETELRERLRFYADLAAEALRAVSSGRPA